MIPNEKKILYIKFETQKKKKRNEIFLKLY